MFALNLAECEDIVKQIVTNAIKELTIEKEVKDIEELWKHTEFTVVKHYKGI